MFNAATGNFSKGFSFAGEKAYLAKSIITVKESIAQIKAEFYKETLKPVPVKVLSVRA